MFKQPPPAPTASVIGPSSTMQNVIGPIRFIIYIGHTLEPRYNTIRYNTNSDITRMRFGPQFFLNLPFFISLERKYVFQTC